MLPSTICSICSVHVFILSFRSLVWVCFFLAKRWMLGASYRRINCVQTCERYGLIIMARILFRMINIRGECVEQSKKERIKKKQTNRTESTWWDPLDGLWCEMFSLSPKMVFSTIFLRADDTKCRSSSSFLHFAFFLRSSKFKSVKQSDRFSSLSR